MTNVKLRFVHDDCGQDGTITAVYFRTDGVVLIEGVCLTCTANFVRNYDATQMLIQYTEKAA